MAPDRNMTSHADVSRHMRAVLAELKRIIMGLDQELDLMLCAVLSSRHVLLEGIPGLGKTLLTRSLAGVLGCSFRRIQFTPDLLPADILGGNVYNPREGSFTLRRGPIFAQVILADEINRAPAKTQSALLEVMQERQVTLDGETLKLEPPFLVLATQNPIEHEGVYALPQAQLDRFGMRIILGYPPTDVERAIYSLHRTELPEPRPVLSSDVLIECQRAVAQVTVADDILNLAVMLAQATRRHDGVLIGASPRVGVDLLYLSRARALLEGRGYVIPDDIKHLFVAVANHRIQLSPRAEISGLKVQDVLHEALSTTKLV